MARFVRLVPVRGQKRPFSHEQSRDSLHPSPDSEKSLQCHLLVEGGKILGLFVYLMLIKMPPERQNIGRRANEAKRKREEEKMKQKKKQHNEMKEIDYICHSHMLLNHHNNMKHEMKQVE
ncbi:hypothetical protein AVEN_37191-1 [Araneus ventricosus]|uniref:Uncharacterized protein n=1 Tax=Araneus ventricosus TaxID=182803 RepID=A0A4Y2MTJ1_ARAVE|nr:hypothetical protein AVEN_37191-1 [Araneus ventricosus]